MLSGNLPDGWKWMALENVAVNEKNAIVDGPFGSNLKVSDYIDDTSAVPVLTTKNLERGYGTKYLRFISYAKFEELKRSEVRGGDIIVAKIGSCGKTGIYPKNMPSAIIPANLLKFTVHPNTNKMFVYYYLNSTIFQQELQEITTATAQPAFNVTKFRQLPIPVPPLIEQERIVAKIEELFTQLDAGTAALKRVQAGLKRYKASVLKAACEGKLFDVGAHGMRPLEDDSDDHIGRMPSAPTEQGELPDGWLWVTTGELCDCIVPNRDKPKSFSGDIPWITLPDFSENIVISESKSSIGLSEEEVKKYRAKIIPKGSVVMSCIGRFGITAVATRNIVVNQQLHAFLVSDNVVDARYLAYAIRTQITYMEKIATATTISYLNKENCNSIPIPLPPLSEQRRIVAEVERRLSVAAQVEATLAVSVARAARLRQSVLKSAFEGRLV